MLWLTQSLDLNLNEMLLHDLKEANYAQKPTSVAEI